MHSRLLLIAAATTLQPLLSARTFTDRAGNSLEGELIGAYGNIAYVKLDSGRTCFFDFRHLSKEDIEHVYAWAIENAKARNNRPAAGRSDSELTRFLCDNLVSLQDGKLKPYDLASKPEPEFYAFYSSASWCGPCRRFSPKLVSFYNIIRPAANYDNFEIILLSSDDGSRSMQKYMAEENMQWPAVKHSKARASILNAFRGSGIPCLVITDRNGNILAHSYSGDEYLGPDHPLEKLREFLKWTNRQPEQQE